MVLEVVQTAPPNVISRSYRRLALKLHPDRNPKPDATEAFQLVCHISNGDSSVLFCIILCTRTDRDTKARTGLRDIERYKQTPRI
jgi:hypothetical protein